MINPLLTSYQKVAELPFASFYLNTNKDTLLTSYAEGTDLDLEMAKEVVEVAYPFAKAGAKYGITDATQNYLNMSEGARKYLRDNKANNHKIAYAVVVRALSTRILVDFFLKFDKPTVPLKVFNNFEDAEKWLKTF